MKQMLAYGVDRGSMVKIFFEVGCKRLVTTHTHSLNYTIDSDFAKSEKFI